MSLVTLKPGAIIGTPAPAGFRILAAVGALAAGSPHDVVITSGMEDRGRKPDDTHMLGLAYDLSVAGLEPSEILARYRQLGTILGPQFLVLYEVPPALVDTLPQPLQDIAYPNAGATAPHIHVALKHGQTFP